MICFRKLSLSVLIKTTSSDHYPLLLSVPLICQVKGSHRFKFEKTLLVELGFASFVTQHLQGCGEQELVQKLDHCDQGMSKYNIRQDISKVWRKTEVART